MDIVDFRYIKKKGQLLLQYKTNGEFSMKTGFWVEPTWQDIKIYKSKKKGKKK